MSNSKLLREIDRMKRKGLMGAKEHAMTMNGWWYAADMTPPTVDMPKKKPEVVIYENKVPQKVFKSLMQKGSLSSFRGVCYYSNSAGGQCSREN